MVAASDPPVVLSSQVAVSKVAAPCPPIPILAPASNILTSLPPTSKWATLQADLDVVAGKPGVLVVSFDKHHALKHISCKACSVGASFFRISGDA